MTLIYRTYLRAFELDDYKTTLIWHNDDEIWSKVVGPKQFVSSEYEKKWMLEQMTSKEDVKLAICLEDNSELIGIAYLTKIDLTNRSAMIGYMIGEKKYWGRGFATDAVIQLLAYGFHERGLNRISCIILEENIGSRKIVQKIGFKKEGLFRDAVFKNGRFQNQVVCSILKDEFNLYIEGYTL